MKCMFVHFASYTPAYYSHAIAVLASIAETKGYEIGLTVVHGNQYTSSQNEIIRFAPDVIVFSLTSVYWSVGNEYAKQLKAQTKAKLWVGGSHINANPLSFYSSFFDAACFGDGEYLFGCALEYEKNKEVFRHPSWLTHTETPTNPLDPSIIPDFDLYPIPKFSLFAQFDILSYPSLCFSRGCIYSCNYCMSRKGGYAKRVRWKSPQRAVDECKALVEYCDPEELYFDDDTITKNATWLKEFFMLYQPEVGLPFYCNSRPELITEEICLFLKSNKCAGIGIGIESGNYRIRKDILGRDINNDKIVQAFDLCHAHALKTWSFNMVNIPTETFNDLLETIQLNEIIKPTYLRVSSFVPYPGTPMHQEDSTYPPFFYDANNITDEKKQVIQEWLKHLKENDQLWNDE